MYKETAEFIIGEITKERIPVIMKTGEYSSVTYDIYSTDGIIDLVKPTSIELPMNNYYEERDIPRLYLDHQADLIVQYGTDLFCLLHEIGHLKTAKGLSIKATIENKKKTDAILHYRERERAYRNMPVERRADKWAFNWLLKHPKQARYYQQMLELARNG